MSVGSFCCCSSIQRDPNGRYDELISVLSPSSFNAWTGTFLYSRVGS